MGKFLDKFKAKANNFKDKTEDYIDENKHSLDIKGYDHNKINPNNKTGMGDLVSVDDDNDLSKDDTYGNNDYPIYEDEIGVQPAQKPESFHHFILENQYKDLERSIRGLKDVWDKQEQKWKTKRKDMHCFTDEEAEDILRTAQSHLATDIKLGFIKTEVFGNYMDAVYKELAFLFESIAEYRYGRYGHFEKQYHMKLQNNKIFLELWTRVQANYSRSIAGAENKATHGSVRGQESLQSNSTDYTGHNRGQY